MSKLNISALLGSKKFKAFLVAQVAVAIIYAATYLGMDSVAAKALAPEISQWVVYLTLGYLGCQGLADLGKEKALVEGANGGAPPE